MRCINVRLYFHKRTAFIPVCARRWCVHRRVHEHEHVTDHCDVVLVVVILLPCRAFYLFIVFSTLLFSPVLQLVVT